MYRRSTKPHNSCTLLYLFHGSCEEFPVVQGLVAVHVHCSEHFQHLCLHPHYTFRGNHLPGIIRVHDASTAVQKYCRCSGGGQVWVSFGMFFTPLKTARLVCVSAARVHFAYTCELTRPHGGDLGGTSERAPLSLPCPKTLLMFKTGGRQNTQ